jgi:hypothetical protein
VPIYTYMAFEFPITFKEFVTDPVKAILFLCLVAIMYLYIDNKMVYKDQIEKYEARVEKLEKKVETLENKLLEINNIPTDGK